METMDHILLFDGDCLFCNATVEFFTMLDKKKRFRFAALRSEKAEQLFRSMETEPPREDTMVYCHRGKAFIKSTGALKAVIALGGLWKLAGVLMSVPLPIRDGAYSFIAKHRHRLIRKKDACKRPSKAMLERML